MYPLAGDGEEFIATYTGLYTFANASGVSYARCLFLLEVENEGVTGRYGGALEAEAVGGNTIG